MINPKNKRVQVTLPGETAELLESLSKRYSKSNSEIVKWAINVLAAKKRHSLILKYNENNEDNEEENKSYKELKENFDKAMKDREEISEEEKKEILDFVS